MARAGRKRKKILYPSRAPDKQPDDKKRTSRQPHRRALKGDARLSEKAESPLGRLLLAGLLNEFKLPTKGAPQPSARAEQRYQAGELYAKVVDAYRGQLDLPRLGSLNIIVTDESPPADGEEDTSGKGCPSVAADPIERQVRIGGRVITVREWPCLAAGEDCACARRRERYDGAFEALAKLGRRALMAVHRVVVHREPLAQQDLVYLDAGLDTLAQHFGIDGGRRRRHSRNAN